MGAIFPIMMFMMVQRRRISSNSQLRLWLVCLWPDVYDGSKTKNFKQFTTCKVATSTITGCLWWFKDEEFQAIHNATSKMFWVIMMFMMVQRRRISSNSQHIDMKRISSSGCLWWFKDEEFQAIHNWMLTWRWKTLDVYDGSKTKNFKQFTTVIQVDALCTLMFMMVQRRRISSNSQPHRVIFNRFCWCLWWFKDEEFQAIHNATLLSVVQAMDVYDGSKTKNFKQFTTTFASVNSTPTMFMMVQRRRISSNSQRRQGHGAYRADVYDGSKTKNFKQFTTPECKDPTSGKMFMMVQRRRISSNSQQQAENTIVNADVYDGSKTKNFKQFTTQRHLCSEPTRMFMMVQRRRISSNSQLSTIFFVTFRGCLWWFKDEEFQAIHNSTPDLSMTSMDVYDGSKTKNFKQFTTDVLQLVAHHTMFMMVQRRRISSNSQQRGATTQREITSCLNRAKGIDYSIIMEWLFHHHGMIVRWSWNDCSMVMEWCMKWGVGGGRANHLNPHQ